MNMDISQGNVQGVHLIARRKGGVISATRTHIQPSSAERRRKSDLSVLMM
jgi:hypothetical protein